MSSEYTAVNRRVRDFAAAHRYKTMLLGDGERVIRLRGKDGFASLEGPDLWGFYCPSVGHSAAKKAAHGMEKGTTDASGDGEAYIRASYAVGVATLAAGPAWMRARKKRPAPAHLPTTASP